MSEFTLRSSDKAVVTTVASSASSQTLIAANPARRKLIISNPSTAILYILLGGGTATATTAHSIQIPSLGTVTIDGFTGAVSGIHASANGSVQITELV